jgi:hypothetical protein
LKQRYRSLLNTTSRVVGQAKRFSADIGEGVKQATSVFNQVAPEGLRAQLDEMMPLVRQVMKQTRARIFHGNAGKLLSLFEPSIEVIRKGKAGKPNEFGKMIKLQEAENQIIVDYEVYGQRPNDCDLLVPAIDTHQALLGCAPHLAAADAVFYSAKNEAAAKAKGVKRVCIPNRSVDAFSRDQSSPSRERGLDRAPPRARYPAPRSRAVPPARSKLTKVTESRRWTQSPERFGIIVGIGQLSMQPIPRRSSLVAKCRRSYWRLSFATGFLTA